VIDSLAQPADTLLSQINKGHGPKGPMVSRLITLGKEAGVRGLFAGLGPRMSTSLLQLCIFAHVEVLIDPDNVALSSHDRRFGHRSVRDLQVHQGCIECARWSRYPKGDVDGDRCDRAPVRDYNRWANRYICVDLCRSVAGDPIAKTLVVQRRSRSDLIAVGA
jgi:hypothetical protein